MTFEELKKEFTDNGFEINDNSFVKDVVSYSTININGQIMQQPHHSKVALEYVCEGSISDPDGSNSYPIFEFELLDDNNESVGTFCVENYEGMKSFINI